MPIMGAVGLKGMKLEPWIDSQFAAWVVMTCGVCGERLCQYSLTDLDELTAEYGAHLENHPLTVVPDDRCRWCGNAKTDPNNCGEPFHTDNT